MKKFFNKNLVRIKKDDKDFKNSTKCWIRDNVYVKSDVKVKDHCHIIGKYRGSAHKDCNIKIKLNQITKSQNFCCFPEIKILILMLLSKIYGNLILK